MASTNEINNITIECKHDWENTALNRVKKLCIKKASCPCYNGVSSKEIGKNLAAKICHGCGINLLQHVKTSKKHNGHLGEFLENCDDFKVVAVSKPHMRNKKYRVCVFLKSDSYCRDESQSCFNESSMLIVDSSTCDREWSNMQGQGDESDSMYSFSDMKPRHFIDTPPILPPRLPSNSPPTTQSSASKPEYFPFVIDKIQSTKKSRKNSFRNKENLCLRKRYTDIPASEHDPIPLFSDTSLSIKPSRVTPIANKYLEKRNSNSSPTFSPTFTRPTSKVFTENSTMKDNYDSPIADKGELYLKTNYQDCSQDLCLTPQDSEFYDWLIDG